MTDRHVIVQQGPNPDDRTAEVKDLFSSPGFQRRWNYAKSIEGRRWILTTEHSLVPAWSEREGGYDTTLEDLYENEFPDMTLDSWRRKAYLMLRASDGKWLGDTELVFLADREWVEALAPRLESHPCPVREPFANITDERARREWIAYHANNPAADLTEHDPLDDPDVSTDGGPPEAPPEDSVSVYMTAESGRDITAAVADSAGKLGWEPNQTRPPEHHSVEFIDFPFNSGGMDWGDYLEVVAAEQPELAVAPDVMKPGDLADVIALADQLDRYAGKVIVVPKAVRPAWIPDRFRIGIPAQDSWGDSMAWPKEVYRGKDVHILGGSPAKAMKWSEIANVRSVDTASVTKAAYFYDVWENGRWASYPEETDFYDRVRRSLDNFHVEINHSEFPNSPRVVKALD